jgi:hypothetical protein
LTRRSSGGGFWAAPARGVLAAVFGTPASAAELALQQEDASDPSRHGSRPDLLDEYQPVYSTSSAFVVGDAIYLVDCSDGAGKRLHEAPNP